MGSGRANRKSRLTHIDTEGHAKMVDVSEKALTRREAVAGGAVFMERKTLSLILNKKIVKGDVFATARLAGLMAAKKTSECIPLCHPLPIASVSVNFKPDKKKNKVGIEAKVTCTGQTGVEMEALMAVSAAALTVYDMCKAVDREMVISDILLLQKSGGRSGTWVRGSGRRKKTG